MLRAVSPTRARSTANGPRADTIGLEPHVTLEPPELRKAEFMLIVEFVCGGWVLRLG